MILHSVFRCLHQSRSEVTSLNIPKSVGEPFDNSLLVSLIHLPDENGAAAIITFVGIGNIKIVFQRIPAPLQVEYSDALAVLVDPPLKHSIPSLQFCDSSGVRTLRINQNLLVKAALIIAAGRG